MKKTMTALSFLLSATAVAYAGETPRLTFKDVADEGDRFTIESLRTPYGNCDESINDHFTPNARLRLKEDNTRIVRGCVGRRFNYLKISSIAWLENTFVLNLNDVDYSYTGDANGDSFVILRVTKQDPGIDLYANCEVSQYRTPLVFFAPTTPIVVPSPIRTNRLSCQLTHSDGSPAGSIVLSN